MKKLHNSAISNSNGCQICAVSVLTQENCFSKRQIWKNGRLSGCAEQTLRRRGKGRRKSEIALGERGKKDYC